MTKTERKSVWTTADISTDQNSDAIDMRGYHTIALQAIISGTATLVGPVYIQGSMNFDELGSSANWTTLEDANGDPITAATLASGAGAYSDGGVTDVSWPHIRFFFDRTSGTGIITGHITMIGD